MSEPFDEQVELAMIKGLDVQDHLASLTPRETDPLQLALAEYSEQIAKTGKVMPAHECACGIQDRPDLKALAQGYATEIIEGYGSLVRAARQEDWQTLLEQAFMRGFNESTMQRMRSH